jgi:hypothetical protein
MQWKGYDEKIAKQEIANQDKSRREFLQHHFRCKPEEPCAYDFVINTSHIGIEAAADFIIKLAETKLAMQFSH